MARIRSIKPEFWDSADTAAADLRTRLLYIAMWNWADDYGIGDGHPGRIITFAFPNDDIPVADYPRNLADVSRAFGVVFFEHCGRPYFVIPEWDNHQRTEKRAKPKDGLLEAAQSAITAARQQEAESPTHGGGLSAESRGSSGAGSRKGNRGKGTGEEQTCATPSRTSPCRFDEFWDTYPRHRDKRKAEKAYANALRRADADTIIGGAHRYATDPNRCDQFTKYAEGWLNGDGWLDEPLPARVNRLPVAVVNGRSLNSLDAKALGYQEMKE